MSPLAVLLHSTVIPVVAFDVAHWRILAGVAAVLAGLGVGAVIMLATERSYRDSVAANRAARLVGARTVTPVHPLRQLARDAARLFTRTY